MVLGGVWFEWPLYDMYMHLLSLHFQPFIWPPVVLCHNLENLAFWHSRMLLCLDYLTLLMKAWHCLKVKSSKTPDNHSTHVCLCSLLNLIVLLMDLEHLFNNTDCVNSSKQWVGIWACTISLVLHTLAPIVTHCTTNGVIYGKYK